MKTNLKLNLIALGLLTAQTTLAASIPNIAGEPKLFGSWELTKFEIISTDGTTVPFCENSTGIIIYEKSGHMSVSINCGEHGADKVPSKKSPGDDYGGMLFYAGSFEIQGDSVVHHITNSSHTSLIGKDAIRKVETLTDTDLVLTGKFGSGGQTLRIEWIRESTSSSISSENQIGLLTYLKLKPGTEDSFKKEFAKIIAPSRSEPGNIAWYVQQSQDDPTEIVFYTRWVNQQALDSHLKSPPLAEYIANTAGMLASGYPKLVRYRPIDTAIDVTTELGE